MVTKQLTKMASFLRCINHRKLVCTNALAATYLLWKLMTSRCQRYIFSLWKITCVRTVFESSMYVLSLHHQPLSQDSLEFWRPRSNQKLLPLFLETSVKEGLAAAQTFYEPIVCPRASCTCLNTFSLHCFWRKTNSTRRQGVPPRVTLISDNPNKKPNSCCSQAFEECRTAHQKQSQRLYRSHCY